MWRPLLQRASLVRSGRAFASSSATPSVFLWGGGQHGCLGSGANTNAALPTLHSVIPSVTKVAVGQAHTAWLNSAGQLFTAGMGKEGALGHGSKQDELVPKLIANLPPIADVACGHHHTVAVSRDGEGMGRACFFIYPHAPLCNVLIQESFTSCLFGTRIRLSWCGRAVFTWGWGGIRLYHLGGLGQGSYDDSFVPGKVQRRI
jgi:hypothetical protein